MEFFAPYLLILWLFVSKMSKLQVVLSIVACVLGARSSQQASSYPFSFFFVTTCNVNKLLFFIIVACKGARSSLLFFSSFVVVAPSSMPLEACP